MNWLLVIISCLVMASTASAETFSISYERGAVRRRFPEDTKPVIGLALSGGGARGLAHIGVLDVFEEKGLKPDRISGTSMGSIVGGLYAAGYSTRALRDIIGNIDWNEAFSSAPKRRNVYIGEKVEREWPLFELRFDGFRAQIPSSLSSGQRIASLLSWLTLSPTYESDRDFDRLPTPFRAVTTDIKTDSTVVIGEGNLGEAIRASSTIPLLFSPVERGELLLVDGGLKNNLPVDAARDMGSDFVIAVAIDESMHDPRDLNNFVNIVDQVTSILMRNITRLSKDRADFVIEPDMENFSSRNFSAFGDMIEEGRRAALAAWPALEDTLASITRFSRHITVRHVFISPPLYQNSTEHVMFDHIALGEPTTFAAIAAGIESLWNTGQFVSINADLDEVTGVLDIKAVPLPESIAIHIDGAVPVANIAREYRLDTRSDGRPDIKTAAAAVDSLVRSIRSAGYSFAVIGDTTIDETSDIFIVDITIPRVTRIDVAEGLKTRNSLVMREMKLSPGDVFDIGKLMESVDNLYGTNLYELVTVDVRRDNGGVAITIDMKEKNWTVARFGLRYDEMFQSEGRITLIRENIMGFGNNIAATGHTGSRRRLIMLENTSPRIYKTFYTFSFKTYRAFSKRPVYGGQKLLYDYEDERYGTVFSLGQQMDKLGNAMFEFKTETIRVRYAPAAKMKNENKEFRSVIFRSLIDSYDSYPFPRSGNSNVIFIESATDALGGSEQFVKIFWSWTFARTHWRRHTFNGALTAGTADPSTPAIDAFTLGGDASRMNCYDQSSAASHYYADFPGLAHEERRGTRLAVGKIGYRLFIPRAFHLDFMYSIGNVWTKDETITAETLLQSYGVKGSFSTYFGPLSFGWGITSEGHDRVYTSAGWEF